MKPKIIKITIPGLKINARVWGPDDGIPVLAMHGWLDNAASFDLVAPLLTECRVVAIDFPGHGFSDQMPVCSPYHHEDRIIQMFQVADALGWQQFNILGHSMGGVIGTFMAAVFPERILKIVVIDVIPFLNVYVTDVAAACRTYLERNGNNKSNHTVYPNYDEAAKVRAKINPLFAMKHESALALTQGGMVAVTGGFAWTFDMRLLLPNFMQLTDEMINMALAKISAEYHLIAAEKGLVAAIKNYQQKIASIASLHIYQIAGNHHVHLDEPDNVAAIVNRIFIR